MPELGWKGFDDSGKLRRAGGVKSFGLVVSLMVMRPWSSSCPRVEFAVLAMSLSCLRLSCVHLRPSAVPWISYFRASPWRGAMRTHFASDDDEIGQKLTRSDAAYLRLLPEAVRRVVLRRCLFPADSSAGAGLGWNGFDDSGKLRRPGGVKSFGLVVSLMVMRPWSSSVLAWSSPC